MTEAEIELLQTQAKEHKGLPKTNTYQKLEICNEGFSPTGFRGSIALLLP